MNSATRAVFPICALLCSLSSCTDDFSRFYFGQKRPAKALDSGTQNMSDAAGNDPDGGAGEEAAQSE